jgi:GPI mannosyltransferase 3
LPRADVEWRVGAAWALLAIVAAARLTLAIVDQYPYFPDEVYQALEPAHRAAFGYGFRAWEFVDGARSWLFPGVLAVLFRIAHTVGVTEGLWLVCLAKLAVTSLSLAGLWAAMGIAGRRVGPWGAIGTGVILGFFPLLFVTWHRTLSENVGASLALCALALVDRVGGRRAFYGGLVAGLGVFVRFQGGLFVLAFVLVPLVDRRFRDAAWYVAGAALAGVLGGALDWVTWGRPFHSFLTYVDFNLVQNGAVYFGVAPRWFYFERLAASPGLLGLPLLAGLLVGLVRFPVIGLTALAFAALHMFTPHKELRFIIPALALAAIPAGVGLVDLGRLLGRLVPRLLQRSVAIGLVVSYAGLLGWLGWTLSWGEVGVLPPPPRARREDQILLLNRDTSRALSWLGQRRDMCGAIVRGRGPIWTGGYVYLHRDVPLFFRDTGDARQMANYVIAPDAQEPVGQGYLRVRRIGTSIIYRRQGPCIVPEGYEPPIASDRPTKAQIEEAARASGLR